MLRARAYNRAGDAIVCGVEGIRVIPVPSEVVVVLMRGVERGVVFMGVAFRGLPGGHSPLRLPQPRDPALQGSTHD